MSLATYYANLDIILAPARARGLVAFDRGEGGWDVGNGYGHWLVKGVQMVEVAVEQACAEFDRIIEQRRDDEAFYPLTSNKEQ